MVKRGQIRPIAICIFRDEDSILVFEGYDPVKDETYYRPLGGGIEFGEHSRECIAREIREELGAEIKDLTYVGMIENVFICDGQEGHEIVLIYEAHFVEQRLYDRKVIKGQEDDGSEFIALWKPVDEFRSGTARLYPEGLLDLLDGERTVLIE